ncbi:MAG: protein kinase [Chitinivibrionales bacterium]|nr:protein kinase [Chitinivibrionales bacterium]
MPDPNYKQSTDTTDTSDTTDSRPLPLVGSVMPKPHERVGGLRVLKHIDSGGTAVVYKAIHEQLEVVRAVKMLKPEALAGNQKRLRTEAKISANLIHPNIVQIYNVGLWKNTIPFIEMEYIDGKSLKDMISERGSFPVPVALSIAAIISLALDYAHRQSVTLYGKSYEGLVHRDIKPGNILIAFDGTVKLADFGIARPGETSIHTASSEVMGTYAYLSPEQIDGVKLDARTDIYSLGAVLYEMITGLKCFPQESLGALVKAKTKSTIAPVKEIIPAISPKVSAVIDKCIAVEKEKRYANSAELCIELETLLDYYSDKPASLIVEEYSNNPQVSHTQFLSKQKIHSNKRFITVYSVTVVAAIALILGALRFVDTVQRPGSDKSMNIAGKPAGELEKTENELPGKKAVQQRNSVSESVSANPRYARTPGKKRSPPPGNNFQKGIGCFRKGMHDKAAEYLEKALHESHPEPLKQIIKLRLLESYFTTGNMRKAHEFSRSVTLNDGYFFLMQGRIFSATGNYYLAKTALRKAQTTPSNFSATTQKDAVYEWAEIHDRIYRKKPNLENKNAAIQAWENYLKAFCKNSSSNTCSEAARRKKELIR